MVTAKQRFIESPAKEKHRQWAETREAEIACDYALLQLTAQETDNPSMIPGAAEYRIQGARSVLEILLSLHRPEEPRPRMPLAKNTLKSPS